MVASWNSIPLEITYRVLGWLTFTFWSVGFYPQVILNFRRKSVVGLSIDFVVLNFTKHSSYLIYNATLYFSSAVQKQYFDKYGFGEMIPVAANDVAFSAHAVFVTAVILFQIAIYERGSQKVSKIAVGIVVAVWLFAAICFFVALPTHSWLWLISIFKYKRYSYLSFLSIWSFISTFGGNYDKNLDLANERIFKIIGSMELSKCIVVMVSWNPFLTSVNVIMLQLNSSVYDGHQIYSPDSWVNFYGNIGKTLLSLICVSFDILFIFQHFVLYPSKKALISPKVVISKENLEPLVSSDSHQVSGHVFG
ncbi:hypothetical protein ACLB2K_053889 [Fragaria x ananassa]